jgi:hypothetical protein
VGDDAVADARYLDVLPLPGGGYRIWYEARLPNDSYELRTELIGPVASMRARRPAAGRNELGWGGQTSTGTG